MSSWDATNDWDGGIGGIDWDLVIERNVRLLGPIVATLCIMAGLAFSSPPVGEDGSARRGEAEALAEPGEGDLPSPTLPRRVHRAVYRLLRATEAAVRRLIVVVARDMVAAEPALPPLKPKRGPLIVNTPICLGLALAPAAAIETPAAPTVPPRRLSFPLLDPLPDPTAPPFHIRTSGVPRISIPGWTPLFAIAPKHEPAPNDPIDAGHLRLRLEALAGALGDLPRQAMRLARWRARCAAQRKAGRVGRLSPLRPGRAYGLHRPGSPRPEHEIDDVLRDVHYFAFEAQERHDTS